MSIDRMATVAAATFARTMRSTVTAGPSATPATVDAAQSAAGIARAVITYIPTEIVTVYVAAVAAINVPNARPGLGQWLLMWIVLLLTPLVVWTAVALKLRGDGKPLPVSPGAWPWLEMVLACCAFLLWSFSLPGSPYESLSWYRPALGSVALLIGTLVIGVIGALARPGAAILSTADGPDANDALALRGLLPTYHADG